MHSSSLIPFSIERGKYKVTALLEKEIAESDLENVLTQLLTGSTEQRFLSEDRAVLLPLSRPYRGFSGIKIKGAGFQGGKVDFEHLHTGDYDLPYYDSEGNYSSDYARAFQRAYRGGMTWQQASNEYRITRYLTEKNFRTYPPLGYGSLQKNGKTSWFCLLAAPYVRYWSWHKPNYAEHLVPGVPSFTGRIQQELYNLGVHLVLHGVSCDGENLLRKDFHTARLVEHSDSFMARVCYFFFDVNFELATLAHPVFDTQIPGWIETAWVDYIQALTGQRFEFSAIEKTKSLLVQFKHSKDMDIYQRMELIKSDRLLTILAKSRMTPEDIFLHDNDAFSN